MKLFSTPRSRRSSQARYSALLLFALCPLAFAQDTPADDDELDVTMQVLTDPQAKEPTEVLQKIPLPKPKGNRSSSAQQQSTQADTPAASGNKDNTDKSDVNDQRGNEERGRDAAEGARERAREAREQRDEARREQDDRERDDRGPPDDRPGRPK